MQKTKKNLEQRKKIVIKLEKTVGKSGKDGRIYLPGKWIGKKVKVTLL
jgi:putative transposon-encoded protein